MPLHPAIGFAKGRAGFATWRSAVRVGRWGSGRGRVCVWSQMLVSGPSVVIDDWERERNET